MSDIIFSGMDAPTFCAAHQILHGRNLDGMSDREKLKKEFLLIYFLY